MPEHEVKTPKTSQQGKVRKLQKGKGEVNTRSAFNKKAQIIQIHLDSVQKLTTKPKSK